jgi:hypothetical protein
MAILYESQTDSFAPQDDARNRVTPNVAGQPERVLRAIGWNGLSCAFFAMRYLPATASDAFGLL